MKKLEVKISRDGTGEAGRFFQTNA
jgi:hypothetical protein